MLSVRRRLRRHPGEEVHAPSRAWLEEHLKVAIEDRKERRGGTRRQALIIRHAIRSLTVRGFRWLGTTSSTTLSSHPLCGQVSGGELDVAASLARTSFALGGMAVVESRIWACEGVDLGGPRSINKR